MYKNILLFIREDVPGVSLFLLLFKNYIKNITALHFITQLTAQF